MSHPTFPISHLLFCFFEFRPPHPFLPYVAPHFFPYLTFYSVLTLSRAPPLRKSVRASPLSPPRMGAPTRCSAPHAMARSASHRSPTRRRRSRASRHAWSHGEVANQTERFEKTKEHVLPYVARAATLCFPHMSADSFFCTFFSSLQALICGFHPSVVSDRLSHRHPAASSNAPLSLRGGGALPAGGGSDLLPPLIITRHPTTPADG